MARTIQAVVPVGKTDQLMAEIREITGVSGLRLQRDGSVQPPGDVITVDATSRALHEVMRILVAHGVGKDPDASVTTTEPISMTFPPMGREIARDSNDATWEEMALLIGKESNMTINGMLIMAIAGVLAGIGIATNAVHIVIGAMVIAPGFEPLSRIALGVVGRGIAWRDGVVDVGRGYVALVFGAALAAAVMQALGQSPLGGGGSGYLRNGILVEYWISISAAAVLVASLASAAGAILVATNRSVLTAGVMIALALVPSAAIAAMALVSGELALAGKAALRWLLEAGLVVLISAAVFLWKHLRVQQRRMSD